jgi:tetratricopeptide (TPR) repeat protein
LPESDLKADYEILLPVGTDLEVKPSVAKIKQAAAKYPNSARLQFRLGTYGKDDQALRRAAELDPNNALPLYFLASRAPSMDGSLALLRDANLRKSVTEYPLPLKGGARAESSAMSVNGNIALSTYLVPRSLARNIGKYASELHKQGRTDEALEALKQVKRMGWKLADGESPTVLSLLVGVAVAAIAEKSEQQIYTEIGSKDGLARLETERKRLDYLQAGARDYVTHANEKLVEGVNRNMAIFLPVLFMGAVQLLILLLSGIWWGVLLLRSRRQPGSETHPEATKSFSVARLAKLYALIFIPATAVSAIVFLQDKDGVPVYIAMYVAAVVSPLVLLVAANVIYRRKAMMPSWRTAPIPDKREFQRRMIGVQGGAMIFLVILGLLISGGTKAATGSYPWDVQSYASKMRGDESKYVQQLLAGKVKVSEELVREIEQRRKQPPRPGGG